MLAADHTAMVAFLSSQLALLWTVPVVCGIFAAKGLLHYFQLESYQFPGYFHSLKRNRRHAFWPGALTTLVCLLLFYLSDLFYSGETALSGNVAWGWAVAVTTTALAALAGRGIALVFSEKKAKKPFVFTGRMKRLCVATVLVFAAINVLLFFLAGTLFVLWPLLLPLAVALAGLLAWPVEKAISELYFRDARRKLLSQKDLIRIGITGSYGKTSVKHILGTILSEKYTTLITPASFNTPMGVTRTIREKLTPSYQVFIGEMGARHVGDIRELCRLVRPVIGIVTSVGPQHLETFKTIDRVASTKYELIDALPQEGSHAYFYDDGSYCSQMYQKTGKPKTLCGAGENADVYATDVTVSGEGSRFFLHIRGKGSVECRTKLLGEHSIHNILLAAAVANDFGLSLKQISHGIEKLQPVKNRLELMRSNGSFTIVNDAFNSNPVGAKAALEVLAQFPQRRIVITPGMVELGAKEADYNREFGRQMASCADIAIVVGKGRAAPILEGLREAGFPEENAYRVDSLEESTKLLHTLVRPTDTVLYENDLPDHYQEA